MGQGPWEGQGASQRAGWGSSGCVCGGVHISTGPGWSRIVLSVAPGALRLEIVYTVLGTRSLGKHPFMPQPCSPGGTCLDVCLECKRLRRLQRKESQ